ncbi:MAG: hypothetical protein ABIT36_00220 [Steroidobacteraceae bacterium]
MTTRLDKQLKREIMIDKAPYILTIDPDGMKLTEKGRRLGQEMRWKDWVNGEAALATALNASLAREPTAKRKAQQSRPARPK